MPAGVTHQLVRQYLLHFGYADTLRAFDSAAGVLPDDEAAPADRWVLHPTIIPAADHRPVADCGGRPLWWISCNVACAVTAAVPCSSESTLRCVPLYSPECPELALRHAARKAIDAGDVWEAERLIQVC